MNLKNPWAVKYSSNSTNSGQQTNPNSINSQSNQTFQARNSYAQPQSNQFNQANNFIDTRNNLNDNHNTTINHNQNSFVQNFSSVPIKNKVHENPFQSNVNKMVTANSNPFAPSTSLTQTINNCVIQPDSNMSKLAVEEKAQMSRQTIIFTQEDDYDYDAIFNDSGNGFVEIKSNEPTGPNNLNTAVNMVEDDYDYDAIFSDTSGGFVEIETSHPIQTIVHNNTSTSINVVDDDYDYDAILSDSGHKVFETKRNQPVPSTVNNNTDPNAILVEDDYDYDVLFPNNGGVAKSIQTNQNFNINTNPKDSNDKAIHFQEDDYDYDAILDDIDVVTVETKPEQPFQNGFKSGSFGTITRPNNFSNNEQVKSNRTGIARNNSQTLPTTSVQNTSTSASINVVDEDFDYDAMFNDDDTRPLPVQNDFTNTNIPSGSMIRPQTEPLNLGFQSTVVDDNYDYDKLFESENEMDVEVELNDEFYEIVEGIEKENPNQPSTSTNHNNWFQRPNEITHQRAPLPDISVQTHANRNNNFFRESGFTTTKEIALPQNCYEDKHDVPPLPHDAEAIKTWVYPINYPLREYQFNIVQKALYYNTLVALPTGLGKTFIAAVVMFNYFRWFPKLKVVFMAPTKPLVSQQIEACYHICGISQNDSIEITGSMKPADRRLAWQNYRVFYITPHVLNNDLKSGVCDAKKFSCVVVDEAHRAIGQYPSAQSVQQLYQKNPLIRILALSATPGSTTEKVTSVICNLFIACIEFRQESSPDIQPYTFDKISQEIVVKLTPIIQRYDQGFRNLMAPFLAQLYKNRAVNTDDVNKIHRYSLLQARLQFRQYSLDRPQFIKNQVEGYFAICFSLCMYLETLNKYGLTSFYSQIIGLRDSTDYSLYRNQCIQNPNFIRMLEELGKLVKDSNYVASMQSHPKLPTLYRYVSEFIHDNAGPDGRSTSKVMVFAQFREPVDEIVNTLKLDPQIKPAAFIGRGTSKVGKGLKMKEQAEVITKFKSGEFNVLVCTSIGEEGLDIGEVDLIVCYDSNSSPIRLLQRIGRTGRRRQGKVCMLLTEGKELRSFHNSKETHKHILNEIGSNQITLYGENPRMVPKGSLPRCEKVHIEVEKYVDPAEAKKKLKMSKSDKTQLYKLSAEQRVQLLKMFGHQGSRTLKVNKYPHRQRHLDPTFHTEHSTTTHKFVKLMQRFGRLKDLESMANTSTLNSAMQLGTGANEMDWEGNYEVGTYDYDILQPTSSKAIEEGEPLVTEAEELRRIDELHRFLNLDPASEQDPHTMGLQDTMQMETEPVKQKYEPRVEKVVGVSVNLSNIHYTSHPDQPVELSSDPHLPSDFDSSFQGRDPHAFQQGLEDVNVSLEDRLSPFPVMVSEEETSFIQMEEPAVKELSDSVKWANLEEVQEQETEVEMEVETIPLEKRDLEGRVGNFLSRLEQLKSPQND